jgi:hypothetical protein
VSPQRELREETRLPYLFFGFFGWLATKRPIPAFYQFGALADRAGQIKDQ